MQRFLLAVLLLGCGADAQPSMRRPPSADTGPTRSVDAELIDALVKCEPASSSGEACGGGLLRLYRLTRDAQREELVPSLHQRAYARRDGTPITVVTPDEYEARLARDPDVYVSSLVVTLDWVDESTISVTAFGGHARLSDRAKHIGVGLSGCGPAHYDVVSAHGNWTCGDRKTRRTMSAACEELFRGYVATLNAPPICSKQDDCAAYDCEWMSSQPSGDADQIVANFVGLGCGSIRFSCPTKGEPGVPRVVLE